MLINFEKEKMNKKVLISGCSGQDASIMSKWLLDTYDNIEIYGTVRHNSAKIYNNIEELKNNPRFHLTELELTDSHNINDIVSKIKPDYFVNLAANSFVPNSWISPRQVFLTNTIPILDILEAIKNHCPKCRFYQANTSEMFGEVAYSPQDENCPYNPQSIYGASKVSAAMITRVYRKSHKLYAIQGVLFNHESSARPHHFLSRKVTSNVARIRKALMNNQTFEPMKLGNMAAKRDWSHAKDFVEGIWRMLNQDIYNKEIAKNIGFMPEPEKTRYLSTIVQEYVLASGETHTVAEFVEKAFECAGIDVELKFASHNNDQPDWKTAAFYVRGTNVKVVEVDAEFYRPAEVDILLGNSTKIKTELGWQPTISFDQLVDEMVQHDIKNS